MIEADSTSTTLTARAASLFTAFRQGDDAAMADLVTLVTPLLWHAVRAHRLDRQSAEDVIQSTWLALVRSADSIAEPQAVVQWLIVSARRESWRVIKKDDRAQPTDFDSDDLLAPMTETPEDLVLRSDSDSRLWQHILQLSDRCRALLRVIAFADRPDYAAIADAMGMPVGSIGPTRGRCLAKLRDLLANDPEWETT